MGYLITLLQINPFLIHMRTAATKMEDIRRIEISCCTWRDAKQGPSKALKASFSKWRKDKRWWISEEHNLEKIDICKEGGPEIS